MLRKADVIALRMERQCLPYLAGAEEYDELFRDFSPVPTEGWTEPGRPPTLTEHVNFDDDCYNYTRRSRSEILKGRFLGGMIGYVTREDWELYCCLCRKPIAKQSYLQTRLLELLHQEGPMNIGMMKEFSGLLVKEITPALHKLQAACLIYENQLDNHGDRGWFLFEEEYPEVNLNRYTRVEALSIVLLRFARRQVFFSEEAAKSFYRLPGKDIRAALERAVQEGGLVFAEIGGEWGYLRPEDQRLLQERDFVQERPLVLLIQRNDNLVKANEYWLKERFRPSGEKWENLYYLLIDGELRGSVAGRFKFGPHVIEDILLDLPEEEALRRKDEIIAAVAVRFPLEASPVRRYRGVPTGLGSVSDCI